MRLIKLTQQAIALGLLSLGFTSTQAQTPVVQREAITVNFVVTEQLTEKVVVNASIYDKATVTKYAFINKDLINFLEELTGLTFSSSAKFVVEDGDYNIVDGENTTDVTEYFHWEDSRSVYSGQTVETSSVYVENYNSSWMSYLDVYSKLSKDYLYFSGRTTEPYSYVLTKANHIGTETYSQSTQGHGEGMIDGNSIIFSGSLIYTSYWRGLGK